MKWLSNERIRKNNKKAKHSVGKYFSFRDVHFYAYIYHSRQPKLNEQNCVKSDAASRPGKDDLNTSNTGAIIVSYRLFVTADVETK